MPFVLREFAFVLKKRTEGTQTQKPHAVLVTVSLFPQGVWSRHFPHIRPEHVHPVRSEGPLWLCHVCSHPAGLGGGTVEENTHFV